VTLFEGGRVGGAAVIDELITELAASAAAGEFFEGDMVQVRCEDCVCTVPSMWCSASASGLQQQQRQQVSVYRSSYVGARMCKFGIAAKNVVANVMRGACDV
jgi:hypothetical protein